MQENDSHTLNYAFMNSKCIQSIKLDLYSVYVVYSSRILSQVASLSFSISIVVRGNHDHFLAQLG